MVEAKKKKKTLIGRTNFSRHYLCSRHLFYVVFFDRWIIISSVRHDLYQTSRKIKFIYKLSETFKHSNNQHKRQISTHNLIMSYNT